MTVILGLVGGGVGAVLRFVVGSRIQSSVARPFPLGTTFVNVSGSFLLGLLAGSGTTNDAVSLGLLGGYTTFSTWMGESVTAPDGADVASRVFLPLAAGVAAAWAGVVVGSLAAQ